MRFLLGLLLGVMTTCLVCHHTRVVPPLDQPAHRIQDTNPVEDRDDDAMLRVPVGQDTTTLEDLAPRNDQPYTIHPSRGQDGYHMDRADFDHDDLHVRVLKYRSEATFRHAMRAAGQDDDVQGLSYFNDGDHDCVILVRDPAMVYDPATLGHEMTHCIYGAFHKGDYPDG